MQPLGAACDCVYRADLAAAAAANAFVTADPGNGKGQLASVLRVKRLIGLMRDKRKRMNALIAAWGTAVNGGKAGSNRFGVFTATRKAALPAEGLRQCVVYAVCEALSLISHRSLTSSGTEAYSARQTIYPSHQERADRAGDAFIRIDYEEVGTFAESVYRADVHAISVLAVNAAITDNMCHETSTSRKTEFMNRDVFGVSFCRRGQYFRRKEERMTG